MKLHRLGLGRTWFSCSKCSGLQSALCYHVTRPRLPAVYFDSDIECIECDDSDVELDRSCRPQFSDINKVSGCLDKELEASGFTRKDQDDMEKEGDNLHEGDSEANQNILHQHTSNAPRQSSEMARLSTMIYSSADDNSEKEEEHDDGPELEKRLTKQRQRAIQAARGRTKGITSRNSYKDKGGKSSHNSKIQKQLAAGEINGYCIVLVVKRF
ncbi:uncharacterized protein LOC125212799 [Salvia hispanica]|uniref:uncharacterized protein LOC125212799 n=1 Tax=Salvia hispanica TaxID=49212 RepID=UPI0020097087|nr:uncharacterized protein LOC125212799 [Salvia hispanica]